MMKSKKLRRALGVLLALAMCLPLFPTAAFSTSIVIPGEDVVVTDVSAIGISVSGAVWGGWRNYVTAFVKDMEDGFDPSCIWGIITSDAEGEPFYFTGAGMRRVTLYSYDEIDPSELWVSGANLASPFTVKQIGNGREEGSALYLLQCDVGFWSISNAEVHFMYNRSELASLVAHPFSELETGDQYVGEAFVNEITDNGELIIDLSGINLPDGDGMIGRLKICDDEGTPVYMCRGVVDSDPNRGVYSYLMVPTGNEVEQMGWYKLYLDNDQLHYLGNGYEEATIPAFGAPNSGGETPVTAEPEPTAVTKPTSAPTQNPTATPESTTEPTPKPTSVPTPTPTAEPTPTPIPWLISQYSPPSVRAAYHTTKKKQPKKVTYTFSAGSLVYPPAWDNIPEPTEDPGGMSPGGEWITPSSYYTVKHGALVQCQFGSSNGAGYTAQGVLRYLSTSGTEKEAVVNCTTRFYNTYNTSIYNASIPVPDDAMRLIAVDYRMVDDKGNVMAVRSTEFSNYFSSGIVNFTDIPSQYSGARLTITGGTEEKGYTNVYTSVRLDQNDRTKAVATIGELLPGTYDYELSGYSGHIMSGTLTVTGEADQQLSFGSGGLDIPASVELGINKHIEGSISSIPSEPSTVTITTPDGHTHTASSVAEYQQIPAGSRVNASLEYDASKYRDISGYSVDKNNFVINARTEINFTFNKFKRRTISGRLMSGGRPVGSAKVLLRQEITAYDGSSFTYSANAQCDAEGKFSFNEAYSDFGATMEIRAATYGYKETAIPAGNSDHDMGDIALEYQGSLIIIPRLKIEPSKLVDKNGAPLTDDNGNVIGNELGDRLLSGDSSLISVECILIDGERYERNVDWDEEVINGESVIYMRDEEKLASVLSEGKEITVRLAQDEDYTFDYMGHKMKLRERDISVTLDAGRNAEAVAVGYRVGGEIRATVVEPGNDDMVGFLVATTVTSHVSDLDEDGNHISYELDYIDDWTYGTGELTVSYTRDCNVYAFKVRKEDVTVMSKLLKTGSYRFTDRHKEYPGAILQALVRNTKDNQYVLLDDLMPEEDYLDLILGPYSFDYTIRPYSEDMSYVILSGTLTKRDTEDPDKDALNNLSFTTELGNPVFSVDGVMCGTDGIWRNRTETGAKKNITSCSVYAILPLNESNEVNCSFNVAYQRVPGVPWLTETIEIKDKIDMFAIDVPEEIYIEDEREMASGKRYYNDTLVWTNWVMRFSMRAYIGGDDRENTITIWDNGVPVNTIDPCNFNKAWGYKGFLETITAELTDKDVPGVHTIWATREKKNADGEYETISTEKKTVKLLAGGNAVYASDIHWYHRNDKGVQDMHFPTLGSFSGKTIRIWPSKNSIMTFRINNALSSDLTNVYLNVEGGTRHQAKCYYDDKNKNCSYWIVYKYWGDLDVSALMDKKNSAALKSSLVKEQIDRNGISLGTTEGFEIEMDLAKPVLESKDRESLRINALKSYYELAGMQTPDFDDNINNIAEMTDSELEEYIETEKEFIPDELNELEIEAEVSDDGKTFTYTAKPTDSIPTFVSTVRIGDEKEYGLYELYAQMERERSGELEPKEGEGFKVYWQKYETVQGMALERYAVKNEEVVVNGETQYHEEFTKTVYLPSEAADALMAAVGAGMYVSGEDIGTAADFNVTNPKVNEDGEPLLKTVFTYSNNTYAVVDFINSLNVKSWTDAAKAAGVTNGDIIKLIENETGFIPNSVGNAVAVLNVLDYAHTVSQGPSGRAGDDLWEALSHVKDQKARESIAKDILDYEDLRADCYMRDCKVKAGTTLISTTGIFTIPVKIGVFLGGFVYDYINGKAQDHQKNTYETIARDIQNQIKLDAYRAKNKAEIEEATRVIRERIRKGLGYFGYVSEKAIDEELAKYWVLVRENGEYKYRLKSKVSKFNVYIDPSGYVFEGSEDNRVGGITASAYIGDGSGSYSLWEDLNDDEIERQENPQITGDTGRYGWMVPVGEWKVRFEDENGIYQPAESKAMDVPPEHTAVNIGLLSMEAPRVSADIGNDSITLSFSKYMQLESLINTQTISSSVKTADGNTITDEQTADLDDDSFDSFRFAVTFYDASGNQISGKVSFPDKTENTGYTASAPYQTDIIDSKYFARTAVFIPYEGTDLTGATMSFGDGIVSYSGVELDAEYKYDLIDVESFDIAGDGDTATATASIANNRSDKPITVQLIIALYDDGVPVRTRVKKAMIGAGKTETVEAGVSAENHSDAVIKAFLWDPLNNRPLTDAATFGG